MLFYAFLAVHNNTILKRRIVMGILGNTFDLNCDGQLDRFEKAIEFGAFMNLIESEENDDKDEDDNY